MMRSSTAIGFIALLLCVSVAGNSAHAQGTAPTASSPFTQNLALGMSGGDVSVLQEFLIAGGFLNILSPTAYFGPLTRAALSSWQASVGIYPFVGFFGPISRARINSASAPQAPIDAIQVPAIVAPITSTVGTTSSAVVDVQNGSPVRLMIPTIAVNAGFQFNGLKSDGTMEIPDNIFDIGWYTGSPHPGEKGNSIITGHVAQIRKGVMTQQGVFYNLSQLRQGDDVYVLNDTGKTIAFVVRESRLYDPAADATDVFTSGDGRAHLVIITCEGAWNQAELSYSQRLVIFADARIY